MSVPSALRAPAPVNQGVRLKAMTDHHRGECHQATNVVARTEQFTPGFAVQSVDFSLSELGNESVLSIQRAIGPDADEPPEVCLVLSPSQQCAVNPFTEVVLAPGSLVIKLTAEAESMFGTGAVTLLFSANDELHSAIHSQLTSIREGLHK